MFYLVRRITSCPCPSCCSNIHIKPIFSSRLLNNVLDYITYNVIIGLYRKYEAIDIIYENVYYQPGIHKYKPENIIFSFADYKHQSPNSYLNYPVEYKHLATIGNDLQPYMYLGARVQKCMNC